jgi:cysteine-rich repeat protein
MNPGRSLVAVAVALVHAAAFAGDHPVGGDSLLLKDPPSADNRKVRFKATRDPAIDPSDAGDPRTLGATLEVTGEGSGDGATGPIDLDASLWTGLGNPPGIKGYKYLDRNRTNGVKKATFRSGNSGGSLTLSGGGTAWPYEVTQAQSTVDVRFTVGSEVYCAQFTLFRRNQPGAVSAKDAAPPSDCAGPPPTTTTTTIPAVCGNGLAEGAEECDDGNTSPGDGCSPTCQLESVNPALCAGIPTVSGTSIATTLFQSGFSTPVHVAAPRLDPSRVFVVEQGGRIMMVKGGVVSTFLDITGRVASGGERGLLSVAFDPDYETNGFFYVYYTLNAPNPQPDGDVIIARFHASSPDTGDAGSETILVTVPHTSQANHNGGNVNFGPDGFLYAATGDGGGAGDPDENAQNDASMLGKLLRIDPVTGATTNWAKGLRNPFRFSFDRANGDIYIGDVGQGSWEEIDYSAGNPMGVNYGWDDMEGRHCFEPSPGCLTAGRQLPVLEYCNSAHSEAACSNFQPEKGQAVAGGFVYRGCRMPDLRGRYFYSDFYTAFIHSFMGVSGGDAQDIQDHTAALDPPGTATIGNVSSFGEDARGELYIADYDGEIYKIVPGP